MPLGDLAGTVLSLVVANPEIHWRFQYRADGRTFSFDTDPVKRTLGDVPLSEPAVLRVIRETLQEGIRDVQAVPA